MAQKTKVKITTMTPKTRKKLVAKARPFSVVNPLEKAKVLEEDPTLAYFMGSAERKEHLKIIESLKAQLEEARKSCTSKEDQQFFSNYAGTSEFLYNSESTRATTSHDALQKMIHLWEAEVAHRRVLAKTLNNFRMLHADRPVQVCPSCGKVESSKIQQTMLCPDCKRAFKK
jgi:rubrerythrin